MYSIEIDNNYIDIEYEYHHKEKNKYIGLNPIYFSILSLILYTTAIILPYWQISHNDKCTDYFGLWQTKYNCQQYNFGVYCDNSEYGINWTEKLCVTFTLLKCLSIIVPLNMIILLLFVNKFGYTFVNIIYATIVFIISNVVVILYYDFSNNANIKGNIGYSLYLWWTGILIHILFIFASTIKYIKINVCNNGNIYSLEK